MQDASRTQADVKQQDAIRTQKDDKQQDAVDRVQLFMQRTPIVEARSSAKIFSKSKI